MLARFSTLLRSDAAEPLRFAAVGAGATLVHIAVAGIVLSAAPSINAFMANAIAFAVAFFVSFFGHRHVTFGRSGSPLRFLLVAVGGFALNNLLVAGLLTLSASKFTAILVATCAVPVITYLASRFWAFR